MFRTRSSGRRQSYAIGGFRKRWRLGSSTACSVLVAALAAAGCGSSPDAETEPRVVLPADVGAELAAANDEVAQALESGDTATAHAEAQELRTLAVDAIEAGRVPPELRAPLLAGIDRLLATIPAPPPPPADEEDEDEEDEEDKEDKKGGKGKGKGEGKGDGNGDD